MIFLKFIIISTLLVVWVQSRQTIDANADLKDRTFTIDWDNNNFLKDGEPFRFIAGSFHYFRAHPESWQRKLRTMRAAGLNAVTTYVEWSLHNPKDGLYNWEGIADLERFIKLAEAEDLFVILRPGPYICAERDMGGFPFWLLKKYGRNTELRTDNKDYLYEVRKWYKQLMSRMESHLYGNGGPIIMVQVENEYGFHGACNKNYREWLRDETELYVKGKAVLFTNDWPHALKCGKIDGVLATLDFGPTDNTTNNWNQLREYEPKGPLVNAEYYPGWFTKWQSQLSGRSIESVTKTFKDMLDDGANVNFYMFFGGTNFGFTAGAGGPEPGNFHSLITSYDYDAPMTEEGDPTEKYMKIREIIGQYIPLPNIEVPAPVPKRKYGTITMTSSVSLLSMEGRKISAETIHSHYPMSFEALNQFSGLVLYEAWLPKFKNDPTLLEVKELHDRGYVYVDNQYVGVFSRQNLLTQLSISASAGSKLQIFVENLGRPNFGNPVYFKGILSDVIFDIAPLNDFNITKFPLEEYDLIEKTIEITKLQSVPVKTGGLLNNGPTVFYGDFEIKDDDIQDTYLDPTGWGKGIAFVNGWNLGRYWLVGPQITLYVPKEVLRKGSNKIVMIEYQSVSNTQEIKLTDVRNLNGW